MMEIIRRNLLIFAAFCLLSALAVSTYMGEHGVQARTALKARIAGLEKKLVILKVQHRDLELETKQLSPGAISPDLLEFKARELLGFVYENEQIYVQKNP